MNRVLAKTCRDIFSYLYFALLVQFLLMVLPVGAATGPQDKKTTSEQVAVTYVNRTLTEDTSWRGTIVVKGFVVVAPQTTLRIEPGTVIRFMAVSGSNQLPRLVVMGRITSVGTVERPILFAPNHAISNKGDWGGLLLLSSEKRNQLEHCTIEGAETGLEGRFSNVIAKALSITKSRTGCLLRDCTATLTAPNFSGCDTGVEVHDSEVELRDATVIGNRHGMLLFRSSIVMSSVEVTGSTLQGLLSEDCRLKLNACDISDNMIGAHFKGGEGQIFLSRFMRNRETALHLDSARLKISRCQITDNIRDGLLLEDDRAAVWGNAISNNGGFNLVSTGRDPVTASQNWWGVSDELSVMAKLSTGAGVQRPGALNVFPWLLEKPSIFQ